MSGMNNQYSEVPSYPSEGMLSREEMPFSEEEPEKRGVGQTSAYTTWFLMASHLQGRRP